MNTRPAAAGGCVMLFALILALAVGPTVAAGDHTPGHPANASENVSWNATSGNVTGGEGGGGLLGGALDTLGQAVASGIGFALNFMLVSQGALIADFLADAVLQAAVYTPYPDNPGNWFHNPSKGPWPGAWEWHQDWGRPLWALFVLFGGGLGLAFRGMGLLNPAEFSEWSKRWLVGLFVGNWAWELGGLYLYFLAGVKSGILAGVTSGSAVTDALGSGLVWLFVALLLWINILALVVAAVIIGMVIVVTVVLLPFLGALLAARAVPFESIHGPAQKAVKAWVALPLATVPSALFLAGGIRIATAPFEGAVGVADLIRPVALLGGPVLAAVVPLAVYRSTSPRSMSIGFAGAAGAAGGSLAVRERAKHVKEKAQTGVRGARDLSRGARGAAPVGDGGRAYRVASAPRRGVARLRGSDGGQRDVRRLVEQKADRSYDMSTLADRRRDD